jgi:hypothetical protein
MEDPALKDFSENFHAQINAIAHSHGEGAMKEEIFVEHMGQILEENGELETLTLCQYHSRGARVDGYSYDDDFKDITLVTSFWSGDADTSALSVTNTDIKTASNRAIGFFQKALKEGYTKIDVANEAHDLARVIWECRKEIRRLKIVLITDGITKRRPAEVFEKDGIEVTLVIWDLERTFHYQTTGECEKISVVFSDHCTGPLQCVVQQNEKAPYTTYVGFIPGEALADLYKQWGISMLDMNVRVFLSARGKINKGIKRTIQEEPEMFCAYNNGITVFAKSVETVTMGDGISLKSADEFQIVNGGQTTASLYHAKYPTIKKDQADLSDVYVQMKLTVIHDEAKIPEFIPLISKYANRQNAVQRADFAANEKPHPEIQQISSNLLAPDPTGGSAQTYWFYDRARGSYEETRNLVAKTKAQKRDFDALRPKQQKFDKIKFAKAWNSWKRQPHIVSKGAQGNFAEFNDWLATQEEDWEGFFKKTVGLVILWNETERIVRQQSFQGYRHNIVTYSISWLVELLQDQFGKGLDLWKIWRNQTLGDALLSVLEDLAQTVNEHIRDTELNVTEYCKKESCWDSLKMIQKKLPKSIKDELGTSRPPAPPPPHKAIAFCIQKESGSWWDLSSWLKSNDFLTGKARSQCANMAKALGSKRKPSEPLSIACQKIWEDSLVRGYNPSSAE